MTRLRYALYLRWDSGKRETVLTEKPESWQGRERCRVLACVVMPQISVTARRRPPPGTRFP